MNITLDEAFRFYAVIAMTTAPFLLFALITTVNDAARVRKALEDQIASLRRQNEHLVQQVRELSGKDRAHGE